MIDETSRTPPPIQAAMHRELRCDYREVLPAFDVATPVCAGSGEAWRTVAFVECAADLVPEARFARFEGCGHYTIGEGPERFNRVLGDYIDSIDRSARFSLAAINASAGLPDGRRSDRDSRTSALR